MVLPSERASLRRSFFATRHLITGLALTSSRLSHIAPAITVVVRLYRLTMSYVLRKCEEAFCTCSVSFFFKKKNKGEVVTVANYVSLLCRHIIPHHRWGLQDKQVSRETLSLKREPLQWKNKKNDYMKLIAVALSPTHASSLLTRVPARLWGKRKAVRTCTKCYQSAAT